MELSNAIINRRSIRIYKPDKIDDSTIRKIIEAGTWAPSACNVQGWKFIVIDDSEIFNTLLRHGAASFLKSTQQAILVLYENTTDNLEYSDYIQSASACIQNMLLMAYSLGIGTCWVNNLPEKRVVRKIFNIPESYDPIALVSLGYRVNSPNNRNRKYTLDELIAYNHFSFTNCKVPADGKLYIKRIMRRVYYKLPCKKLLLKFVGKFEKKFDN